jgi:hypothetical protein
MLEADDHIQRRLRLFAVMFLTFFAGLVAMTIAAGAIAFSRPGGMLATTTSGAAGTGATASPTGTANPGTAAGADATATAATASSAGAPAGFGVDEVLLLVLAAMAVTSVAGFLAMGPVLTAQARKQWQTATGPVPRDARGVRAALIERYGPMNIVRAAIGEGLGVFACVVTALTGNQPALLAVGFALVMLVVAFPTRDRFEVFVRDVTSEDAFSARRAAER